MFLVIIDFYGNRLYQICFEYVFRVGDVVRFILVDFNLYGRVSVMFIPDRVIFGWTFEFY
jgi:hypothetical protein